MDSAFLTGGTGFVGASLARLLLKQGLKVRALARKGSDRQNLKGLDVEIVEGGLLDKEAIEAGVRGCRYAFHVAADYRIWIPNPDEMYRANVDGTENVLRAAAAAGAERIVHCSSVAAVKVPDDHTPVDETSEYRNLEDIVGHYKKSKYLSDVLARKLGKEGLPVVTVNPAAPIGPYDIKPTPTGKMVVDFLNGKIPSYIDTGLNVVHVEDVAMGHWLAAKSGRIGERYILGGDNLTLKQVLDILAEVTGLPGPKFKTPYAIAYAFATVDTALATMRGTVPLAPLDAVKMAKHYMWFSSEKAKKELGFSPRPARSALKDAADWYRANGYAKPVAAA
ncbi:MAG: NAD-dependent epimerase/dehydratase family protein [Elusimicrobiota bacterium]|nr:MAG: NAD-dependent epimerase/dehydratase family protein [Elusimicrobiota bacterium]